MKTFSQIADESDKAAKVWQLSEVQVFGLIGELARRCAELQARVEALDARAPQSVRDSQAG